MEKYITDNCKNSILRNNLIKFERLFQEFKEEWFKTDNRKVVNNFFEFRYNFCSLIDCLCKGEEQQEIVTIFRMYKLLYIVDEDVFKKIFKIPHTHSRNEVDKDIFKDKRDEMLKIWKYFRLTFNPLPFKEQYDGPWWDKLSIKFSF